MFSKNAPDRTGFSGAVERLVTLWALLGGGLLLLVVAMNVTSVVGGIVWRPFPGDFELTQIGVAIAAFSFLPYCEITGGNVTADIFTSRAGPRLIACFRFAAAVVAFLFSVLLLWRMYAGMLNQKEYDYTTAIVQFPVWIAFLPVLVSLALLVLASVVSIRESARAVQGSGSHG